MASEYLSPSEVADTLGVCRKTVIRELEKGHLKGFKVGRLWRIHPEDLEVYTGRKLGPKKSLVADPWQGPGPDQRPF